MYQKVLACLIIGLLLGSVPAQNQTVNLNQNYSFQYNELDSQVEQYKWCSSNQNVILLLTESNSIYRSVDQGSTFTNINKELVDKAKNNMQYRLQKMADDQIGKVEKIISSKGNDSYLIFKGKKNVWWRTRDCGVTLESVIEEKPIYEFKMHTTEPEWLLVSTYTDCDDFEDNEPCWIVKDLFYSKDFGNSFVHVVDYVYDFDWAKQREFQADNDWIILTRSSEQRQKGHQQFNNQYSQHINLVLTKDYFNSSQILVEGGNKYIFSDNYMLAVKVENEQLQQVRLLVASMFPYFDGTYQFLDSQFPFSHLNQYGYQVLAGSFTQLVLQVQHMQDHNIGNIYISDSDGNKFGLSLKNNVKNDENKCDFQKVKSLEGVYISNVVDDKIVKNKQIKKKQNYKQTKISFNQGASWNSLQAPKKDHLNRTINCYDSESCQLHLHSNSNYQFGPFYSTINAIGLVIGTGNVGKYLSNKVQEVNTFFSRDGGLTWSQIASGSHIYEMANHGGLLLLVDDQQLVSQALFSYNEGISFEKVRFSDKGVYVENVISQPDFKGRHFLVYGKSQNQKGFVSRMDFSNIHQRNCTITLSYQDDSEQDYELWSPKDLSESECLNGAKIQYARKKREVQCFNTEEWEQETKYSACQCQETDYECDVGFRRDEGGICKPDNSSYNNYSAAVLQDKDYCTNGYYYTTQGYRKTSGNQCVGGVDHDAIKIDCSDKILDIDYSYIVWLLAIGLTVGLCSMVEVPNLIKDSIEMRKGQKKGYQDLEGDDADGNQMFD